MEFIVFVDGNDALVVFTVVHEAWKMVVNECKPILVEAITCRAWHNSTSNDSKKYGLAK